MCATLQVSASGFYDWKDRPPSPRTQANHQLLARIQGIHQASNAIHGRPRMVDVFSRRGVGWAFAERMTAELVIAALDTPTPNTPRRARSLRRFANS